MFIFVMLLTALTHGKGKHDDTDQPDQVAPASQDGPDLDGAGGDPRQSP